MQYDPFLREIYERGNGRTFQTFTVVYLQVSTIRGSNHSVVVTDPPERVSSDAVETTSAAVK